MPVLQECLSLRNFESEQIDSKNPELTLILNELFCTRSDGKRGVDRERAAHRSVGAETRPRPQGLGCERPARAAEEIARRGPSGHPWHPIL